MYLCSIWDAAAAKTTFFFFFFLILRLHLQDENMLSSAFWSQEMFPQTHTVPFFLPHFSSIVRVYVAEFQ